MARPGLAGRPARRGWGLGWGRLLGAGVGLAIAGLEALDRDVGVDLGGGGRGVAEDLLDTTQVSAALEEVGRRAVPDAVRAGVPGRARLAQPLVHDAARRARVQAATAHADEQRGPAGRGGERRAARVQPPGYRAEGGHADRHGAFLVALAPDPDGAAALVEVAGVQPA